MAHYDIFRDQLAIRFPAHGHALWEPSPGNLYHAVGVGDVGYISKGRFHRLFNILLPADDPSHENFGVPDNHEPFKPNVPKHILSGILRPDNFCSAGVTLESDGLEHFATRPRDPGEVSFSCRGKQGAVLSLPIQAKREDTVVREGFGKWMMKHIDLWFAWIRHNELEIDRMEDIILVTGTDRTRSWANVAFLGGQADARVSFGVEVVHSRINWQFSPERKTGAAWNWGPSGENLPEEQCIFIRGYRVRKRMKLWPRLEAAAGPNPDPKDDDCEPDAELISVPAVPEYRDPLHVILEYIAEERPNCDMVIVHDDDLALLDVLGDDASLGTLQPDVVLSLLRSSSLVIHEVVLGPDLSSGNNCANADTEIVRVASLSATFEMQFLRTSASEGGRIITARTLQPPLGISKLPVATTMSSPSQTPVSSSQFKPIFDAALGEYKKKTGNDLLDHQIAKELQTCDSVEAVLDIIQHLAEAFYNFREGDKRLMKYIGASVHVLYNISAILGEGVDIGLSSAKAVVVGFGVLLAAAKGVWASHDALVNLFERIQLFLNRLGVYTQIPPTEDMVEILVKVMAEILYILSIATKEMQRSRARIYLKNLLRRTDIEDALNRLDRLTHEEVRMAMARVLEIMNGLRDDTKKSNGAVHQIANDMGEMKDDLGEIKWIQIEQDVQNWFSPPDPSVNYNIACEAYHEGTAVWFFKGSKFKEWELIGSLLWIHGKPGSGKTIICTAIIKYVMSLRDAGLAALAYFYFDFRNEEKQNLRNLLTSLLIQLSAYSEPCRNMIFRLYSMHRKGARQPGIGVLIDCLKEMLKVIAHQPAYIIVDALDECPNMSGVPTPRETVLSLVGDLVRMQLPSLHVCVTSRPEIDIKTVLGSLAYSSVSLHNESGQQKDISDYVHTVVHTDRKMRKWRAEEKKLVVEELSNKADGMFRWVFFQLEALRNCPPSSLRQTLDQLPNSETLDEKYTH